MGRYRCPPIGLFKQAHQNCLNILLVNAVRTSYPSVSVPVRLLCHNVTGLASEPELCLQSYAMAIGSNTNSKLGFGHNDPVSELSRLPLEDVVKISMSDTHTLLLTRAGDVFGCGVSANFLTGLSCEESIQKPVRIRFPVEVYAYICSIFLRSSLFLQIYFLGLC
ncbi:hypothetical protein ANCCAN_07115 [Ancylostoma caninum]|uniref:Regulator of condensation n=1 Tax=Ancylostoma caninum TaxID=29170 RepID=A0A368GR00_ANCCA|nr:hypothetical protein ANCCAN_07115 [Ancylostoma caninum]